MRRILIALGGNAISPPGKKESHKTKLRRLKKNLLPLKALGKNCRLLITHGNGADVGNLLLQQEAAKKTVAPLPLDTLVAMTQGSLGYWIAQTLVNILHREVLVWITPVLVNPKDRAFQKPTKPIGPFYKKKVFPNMIRVKGRGYRRVVASPKPLQIAGADTIQKLFSAGKILIAGGGGGIPVIQTKSGVSGVEAVIDKDLLAAKLAKLVKADTFLVLTDVEHVCLRYGQSGQKKLHSLSLAEAKRYLRAGEFGAGSMKPKIEAGVEFLKSGGKRFVIGHLEKLDEVIKEKSGTRLTKN